MVTTRIRFMYQYLYEHLLFYSHSFGLFDLLPVGPWPVGNPINSELGEKTGDRRTAHMGKGGREWVRIEFPLAATAVVVSFALGFMTRAFYFDRYVASIQNSCAH